MFRKILAAIVMAGGASLLGTAYYIYSYADPDPMPQVAAIVVLSGPGANDAALSGETLDRVNRGIALWEAGLAPVIVMTGGGTEGENIPRHADNMIAYAVARGVPAEVLLSERGSGSTLQNAWFTRELTQIDPAEPVIVVTNRYHLPRAWASFRWAGFDRITLVAADSGSVELTPGILAEGVKWPMNVARAAGARLALAAGAEESDVLPWLR
jgi:uncharacterized SAM-binding protein YcdF (DUF218 family)